MTDTPNQTTGIVLPLDKEKLDLHVQQSMQERANLGHLYIIDDTEDGPYAEWTDDAADSVWRAAQAAIAEAGWRLIKDDQR